MTAYSIGTGKDKSSAGGKHMFRTIAKLFAALLMAYLVIMIASLVFGAFLDRDGMIDVWLAILEFIPFGKLLGTVCIKVFTESLGMGRDMAAYLLGVNNLAPIDFLSDLGKVILTGALIEAVDFFLQSLTGVAKGGGLYKIAMRGICGIVSAFVCTGIAILILQYLQAQLQSVSNVMQWAANSLVLIIAVAGSIGIFYFSLGCSIAAALVMALIKNLLVNAIKVFITYLGVLLVVLYISEGEYLVVLPVIGGWAIVILMMIGVDLMLESIFT